MNTEETTKHRRQLDGRIETYDRIIKGECSCGVAVDKVIGSSCTNWKNGDRYHYPEDTSAWCVFSCGNCHQPIHKTFQETFKAPGLGIEVTPSASEGIADSPAIAQIINTLKLFL